ncbi:MAG: trigger factor [Holosporales bacterium]|jgi:trigger factor|nr:trigger factor [Holosporales bacterium]
MIFENVVSDKLRHEVRVIFESQEIEDEITKCVEEKAKTFRMHGFRPGHVPLDIVRNSVGGSVVKDAFDALISRACDECVKRLAATEIATTPAYRFENNYEPGKDVSIVIAVEIAPSFELKPFECEVTRVIPKVSDDDVKEARDGYLRLVPILEKAQKDHEIQHGDEVTYVAKCYNDGVESKKKSFQNKLLIPEEFGESADFFNNFLGKKAGESFDFVTSDQINLKYKFTIRSIRCPVTGLSTEEIADRKGVKDLADFESKIRQSLEYVIIDTAFLYHKSQILEYLSDQYDFDVPQSIFDYETKNLLAEIKADAAEEEERTGQKQELESDEELAAEYADIIKKRVILGYVLNKVAKENNIVVSQADLQGAVMEEIRRSPYQAREITDFYMKNPNAVAYKKAEIIERKVIDFLMSQAKTTDVEKTIDEVNELRENLLEGEDDIKDLPVGAED